MKTNGLLKTYIADFENSTQAIQNYLQKALLGECSK